MLIDLRRLLKRDLTSRLKLSSGYVGSLDIRGSNPGESLDQVNTCLTKVLTSRLKLSPGLDPLMFEIQPQRKS